MQHERDTDSQNRGAGFLSAMLRPAYLSQKLDRPPTKDGATLRTIRDACDYIDRI
jgi:hypothetical protein